MTWTNVTAPPILSLPTQPLDDVAAALESARASLTQAQQLEWVSVAAHAYQVELEQIEQHLAQFAQRVADAQSAWVTARVAARAWGQL